MGFRDGVERFRPEVRRAEEQRRAQEAQEAQALLDLSRRDRELAEKIRTLGREVVDVLTEHGVPSIPEVMHKQKSRGYKIVETGRRAWVVFHHVKECYDHHYGALVGGVYSDGEYLQHGFECRNKDDPKVVVANPMIKDTYGDHAHFSSITEIQWRCISSETFQRGVASLIEAGRPIDDFPREAYPHLIHRDDDDSWYVSDYVDIWED